MTLAYYLIHNQWMTIWSRHFLTISLNLINLMNCLERWYNLKMQAPKGPNALNMNAYMHGEEEEP